MRSLVRQFVVLTVVTCGSPSTTMAVQLDDFVDPVLAVPQDDRWLAAGSGQTLTFADKSLAEKKARGSDRLDRPADNQRSARQAESSGDDATLPREKYLLEQISGLLKESESLQQQGRHEEAREHRHKAAYRAQQLSEFLRKMPFHRIDGDNLISNGSFERATEGEPPLDIHTCQPGSDAIAGWKTFDPTSVDEDERAGNVEHRPLIVDWIGPDRWNASHGDCSLDIDGGISQSVGTRPGEIYVLTFDMAGNPEAAYPIQRLRVATAGKVHEFPFNPTGSTRENLRWSHRTLVFQATDAVTTIRFVNARPNTHSAGVALDNVSLYQLDPAIATQALQLFRRSMKCARQANRLQHAGRDDDARAAVEESAAYARQLDTLTSRGSAPFGRSLRDRERDAAR